MPTSKESDDHYSPPTEWNDTDPHIDPTDLPRLAYQELQRLTAYMSEEFKKVYQHVDSRTDDLEVKFAAQSLERKESTARLETKLDGLIIGLHTNNVETKRTQDFIKDFDAIDRTIGILKRVFLFIGAAGSGIGVLYAGWKVIFGG